MAVGCWLLAGVLGWTLYCQYQVRSVTEISASPPVPRLGISTPPSPGPVACGATPLSFPAGMLNAVAQSQLGWRALWAPIGLTWHWVVLRVETGSQSVWRHGREPGPDRWVLCRYSDTSYQLSWSCFHQVTRLSAQSDTRHCPAGYYYPHNLSLDVGSYFPSIYIQT